jgi:hypothetical protein
MYPQTPDSAEARPVQSYRLPLDAPIAGPVQLYGERPQIVWIQDAYGGSVPVLRDHVPAMEQQPPRDLAPAPLLDPLAQRVLGAGIGAGAAGAGIGWGAGQAFAGIAAFGGTSSLAIIFALLLATRFGRPTTKVTNHTNVTNTNRWFGRSTTSTHQR